MPKRLRALGLMSGTSMDGIDVALVETDGEDFVRRGPSRTYSYDAGQRARLAHSLSEAKPLTDRFARPGSLAELEKQLTAWHAQAVQSFYEDTGFDRAEIDIIGFHGHTILHRPCDRLTVQLGDGGLLARLTGLSVVNDFRAADVAAGGEGAPFVPVYHQALAAVIPARPLIFVNIGGVANITFIGRNGALIAFDKGPGNALIDDWVLAHTGSPADYGGRYALSGHVDEEMLNRLMDDSYFTVRPPKSLDRQRFSIGRIAGMSLEDGAATLTLFTARSIAAAVNHLPDSPKAWIICGGGRRNPALMGALENAVQEGIVMPAEAQGLNGDALEAEAFAYLAVRSLHGLPLSFPSTTRVPVPMPGGVHHTA
ncbi:MAG TPA: anhydro-N-acetylmuramic acid kinase [Aestuariivirgaceae bacterium]|nr:anhydro-N-acetylmuramic acid kinase [Aestuariivirgaceae bacterium]